MDFFLKSNAHIKSQVENTISKKSSVPVIFKYVCFSFSLLHMNWDDKEWYESYQKFLSTLMLCSTQAVILKGNASPSMMLLFSLLLFVMPLFRIFLVYIRNQSHQLSVISLIFSPHKCYFPVWSPHSHKSFDLKSLIRFGSTWCLVIQKIDEICPQQRKGCLYR